MFTKRHLELGVFAALVAMVAMAFAAASAGAFVPELRDKKAGTALRDLTSTPTNQPDAGEFVNSTEVKLATKAGTIVCTEIEFGTTVVKNRNKEVTLAVPFGVAEGDNCTVGVAQVPTYFDTNNLGAVGTGASTVATVTVTGAGTATVHNLSFSQNIPGVGFCTGEVSGLSGTVANGTEPFGEEGATGLTVKFETEVSISGTGCEAALGAKAKLTGTFRLETPSTATDGWWLE
jgi:hypothetical protein